MNVINKIPGPLLIFMGALSLSFGGLIVKKFEGSTEWQILFWRSLFFTLTVLAFLIITYKKKTLSSFYKSDYQVFLVVLYCHLDFVAMYMQCQTHRLQILIL